MDKKFLDVNIIYLTNLDKPKGGWGSDNVDNLQLFFVNPSLSNNIQELKF